VRKLRRGRDRPLPRFGHEILEQVMKPKLLGLMTCFWSEFPLNISSGFFVQAQRGHSSLCLRILFPGPLHLYQDVRQGDFPAPHPLATMRPRKFTRPELTRGKDPGSCKQGSKKKVAPFAERGRGVPCAWARTLPTCSPGWVLATLSCLIEPDLPQTPCRHPVTRCQAPPASLACMRQTGSICSPA
jgi:hypothetical protein